MSKRTVVMLRCDAPGCKEEFEHTREDPAPGYHITKGMWVLGGGGPIPPTYACSLEHLGEAVRRTIEEELDR